MASSQTQFLQNVAELLETRIAPQAEAMDGDVSILRSALLTLAQANLLGLRIPTSWGGSGLEEATFYQFQELVAQYSGALAFLQAQHQSAGTILYHGDNETLKQTYLPSMASGSVLVGIGFAHLRRNPSPLTAVPVQKGYLLDGTVPWATGFGFFQSLIAAALLPDGCSVYGVVPFQDRDEGSQGQVMCRKPMELAVVNATNTVSLEFQQWYLPETQVVTVKPPGTLHKSDQLNVLSHSFFALGNAKASLQLIYKVSQEKKQSFLQQPYLAFKQEWEECRSAIYSALQSGTSSNKLQLRAWAIELAGRLAQAAVTVSRGAANLKDHPAQRLYREALLFTVSGQTTAVMEATLARLTRPCPVDDLEETFQTYSNLDFSHLGSGSPEKE